MSGDDKKLTVLSKTALEALFAANFPLTPVAPGNRANYTPSFEQRCVLSDAAFKNVIDRLLGSDRMFSPV